MDVFVYCSVLMRTVARNINASLKIFIQSQFSQIYAWVGHCLRVNNNNDRLTAFDPGQPG